MSKSVVHKAIGIALCAVVVIITLAYRRPHVETPPRVDWIQSHPDLTFRP